MASSKTFQEKLVSKDSLQKKYQELAKLSETPLITSGTGSKGGSNRTCRTHFKNKVLVCKLYKYSSGNYYLHDFRKDNQCKYSYIIGQSE